MNELNEVLSTIDTFNDNLQSVESVRAVVYDLSRALDDLYARLMFSDFHDTMRERDAIAYIVALRHIQMASELLLVLKYDIR